LVAFSEENFGQKRPDIFDHGAKGYITKRKEVKKHQSRVYTQTRKG